MANIFKRLGDAYLTGLTRPLEHTIGREIYRPKTDMGKKLEANADRLQAAKDKLGKGAGKLVGIELSGSKLINNGTITGELADSPASNLNVLKPSRKGTATDSEYQQSNQSQTIQNSEKMQEVTNQVKNLWANYKVYIIAGAALIAAWYFFIRKPNGKKSKNAFGF